MTTWTKVFLVSMKDGETLLNNKFQDRIQGTEYKILLCCFVGYFILLVLRKVKPELIKKLYDRLFPAYNEI